MRDSTNEGSPKGNTVSKYTYPVVYDNPANGGRAFFPDFPGLPHQYGVTFKQTESEAQGALKEQIELFIAKGIPLPRASDTESLIARKIGTVGNVTVEIGSD